MDKLKVLDLFSGIGGFSLGLHRTGGFETVGFCEIEEFPIKVLNKNFPGIPVFNDIKNLNKEILNESGITNIDVICGGFPCQPFSNAGKKKGREDDRDLWPEMFRVIKETRPTWVIGENVAGFIGMEFTRTKINLESIGYRVQPFIIPACAVGAQHRRDRVWIVAHLDGAKLWQQSNQLTECESSRLAGYNGEEESVADTCGERWRERASKDLQSEIEEECREKYTNDGTQELTSNTNSNGLSRKTNATKKKNNKGIGQSDWRPEAAVDFGSWWADQPGVGRTIHGFSKSVDKHRRARVKALGNAIVPGVVEIIGRAILVTEN